MFEVKYDQKGLVNVLFETNIEQLITLKDLKVFSGKAGEVYNNLNLENVGTIFVGTNSEDNNLLDFRMSGFNLGKLLISRKVETVSLETSSLSDEHLKAILEGLMDSFYQFEHYKLNKNYSSLKTLIFVEEEREALINETINLMLGIYTTRNLVNMPAIDLTPVSYANYIADLFVDTKVKVEILKKKDIEALGMHGLLAVAKGSDNPPRFVVLRYLEGKGKEHLTIVGKGVTYDSGGYAIKPATSMASMKVDMAGSAAVVGLFDVLAKNNLKTNVVGVMALTENMIDGSAYKNGDIISTMKGTTVEVVNTDAEGRITLADAIYYAATKLKSHTILETSTLTGAVVRALGSRITGVTTNKIDLYNKIHEIGNRVGELNWLMPIYDHLREEVKSDIAEIKNSVAGGGGVMTAGIFLEHFAENKPFIHLDIAGTGYTSGYKHIPKGASGVMVKTFYEYIKENN